MISSIRGESHTNSTTLRANLKKMFIPPEFQNCHNEARLDVFCKAVNRRKEKDRLYRALGAQSIVIVALTPESKPIFNHTKERLDSIPSMNDLMGRILGAVLNHTLGKEMDELAEEGARDLQEKRSANKRKERVSNELAASSSLPSAAAKSRKAVIPTGGSRSIVATHNPAAFGTQEQHDESLVQRQDKRQAKASKARQMKAKLGKAVQDGEVSLDACLAVYRHEDGSLDSSLGQEDHDLFAAVKVLIAASKPFACKRS